MKTMMTQLEDLDLHAGGSTNTTRLEIDNAYLSQQNQHLERELSFARYTINAFKSIAQQKEASLQETQMELERAYARIKMLGVSVMRQQELLMQQQRQLQQLDDKPTLIMDLDSSDDQHELSDEEDQVDQVPSRRPSNIMSKLTLRQPPTMVFEQPTAAGPASF